MPIFFLSTITSPENIERNESHNSEAMDSEEREFSYAKSLDRI